jgi:hypothetical protein
MTQDPVFSPNELVNRLVEIFPAFADEWDEGEGLGYGKATFTYHTVFLTFGPLCYRYLAEASAKEIEDFCTLINDAVESGGSLENAVSTCFLEHASQLGVRKLIKRHLSATAKIELR